MSKWIDADALPRHGQRGGLVHWKDIEDAPSIDIPQWIPCIEKMPSEDELVLVSGEYIEYPCVISKGEDVHYWYSKGIVGIAWMPLPKPYGERKESE